MVNIGDQDTKSRILAAAETEFLARGYDRSRMQAIADRAGINKALLHYYFGGKDELFAEIFREKARSLFPRAEASLRAHSDFIEFTCDFVDLYVSHLIANPFLPFYMLQVATNHPELFSDVSNDFPKRFVRAFGAAARRGEIERHDPRQFLVSLIGMCVMPFIGKNLIQHVLELDDADFRALLSKRADEVKRSVVLLLTPRPGRNGRR
ncbi:MAG: helix-turn-helix domain-containing protein [Myxococcales bacterium]